MPDFNVINGAITAMVGVYSVIHHHKLAAVIYAYKSKLAGIDYENNNGRTKYAFFTLGVFFILYGSAAVLHLTQFK
jgi:hypothetical protein